MNAAAGSEGDRTRAKIPLAGQAEEAVDALTLYYRSYSARAKTGAVSEAERDFRIARMRAIRDTLQLFAEFETEVRQTIRTCIQRKRDRERLDAEIGVLREDPDVQAVFAEFPGTEITGIQDPEEAEND